MTSPATQGGHAQGPDSPLWGVSAEFDTAEGMLAALRRLPPSLGRMDAYSPVPVPGAAEALDLHPRPLALPVVIAAVLAGTAMFAMCTYATIWSYRFNIGGRPLFSWPAFVVPSVSAAALGGAAVAYVALLVSNRLPRLNHPAFNIPHFSRATADRFFVAVESRDAGFDPAAVEAALAALPHRPVATSRVPR